MVVGLGPGSAEYLAPKARDAIGKADVVVGYKAYVDMISEGLLHGKQVFCTGMKGEIQRCRKAIDSAVQGSNTVVVSSGDPGIYGMAGLILELLEQNGLLGDIEIEVVPGIPALAAAAALLGAPLMHDFAVISLSDLLTPWEIIRTRAKAALEADFVLVLYNPKSRKRNWQVDEIMGLVTFYRGPDVPIGIVRNAARPGQSVEIVSAGNMDTSRVDMLTIILIGNSNTRISKGKMITPRGYFKKYASYLEEDE